MRMYGLNRLSNLRYEKLQYEEAILVELELGKEDALFFEHEGKFAISLGTGHAIMNAIPPDQGLYSNDYKKEGGYRCQSRKVFGTTYPERFPTTCLHRVV